MSKFEKEFNSQPRDIQKLILTYIDDYVFKVINDNYSEKDFENFVVNYSSWVKFIIRFKDTKYVFKCAALSGNLDLLKYLHKHNYPKTKMTFANAVKNGNLENIIWLR